MLKRIITTVVTALALALGSLATPAAAAPTYKVKNDWVSTCAVQYRTSPTGTIYTLSPGTTSVLNASVFRVPTTCSSARVYVGGIEGFITVGVWYNVATYAYGSVTTVRSYR